MSTINQIQDEIIEEFSLLDDWMDRYEMIIDMGNDLPPMPEAEKTPDHIIEGCQSRVWINGEVDSNGLLQLRADSDAVIVKGIIAMLLKVLSGQKPAEITNADLYFIDKVGLKEHLSPTRSNGLLSMVRHIKLLATTQQ
ncbi:SufE family protein [Porphyromonas levii]|uniref:SufE family protein n=1 Tax=Porphyromonas levii TaxID=28114 RepID=UPI001B8B94FE|nr:SufE family protein [Porphyromonas levii]MBR8713045.1 Cysteine desulfuration protein SufE [Porphyromonas levii]MBR8715092.1 Cysteine desulfuration protein SufE [Porphyromonas levii]MBR8727545.1 Cysteine desulfuration protein SufE [Porphyromonas levii]MBR8735953.1 Cysteine desulfuration protein SufE [Porphyromonas levii]MBR8765254.1 Cysteine desulfuration protein SufE [Porphyromonas levii]